MRTILAFIAALFISISTNYAQVTTATIEGRVKDAEGKPIPDATVIVRNPKEGINRTTFTSTTGYFSIQGLQPGDYDVAVQHIGYQTQIKKSITLLLGQTATLSFALEQQAVQMGPVEVTAERAPTFELKRTDVSTAIRGEQIRDIPINTRSILDLVQLAPGIRAYAPLGGYGTIPSAGAISAYNYLNLYVDGLEWKSLYNGNIVGLGQTASPLPEDAIQEFRVLINAYDAEYTDGGAYIVSAITRRGTNDFYGTAFGTFENKDLTARGPFQTTKPDYNRQQAGLTIAGPIVRDKLFYSASYELSNANSFADVVPGRPAYNPNIWQQYAGTFKSPRVTHLGAVRLTYQPDNKNTLDLIWDTRYTWSKFYFGGTVAYQAGLYGQYHVNNLMLKSTHVFNERALNELTIQYLSWRHNEPTIVSGPSYVYPSIQLGRGTFPIRLSEDHYTLEDKFTYNLPNFYGDHVLKVGATVSNVKGSPWFPYYKDGEFYFKTDTSSLPYAASIGIGYFNPNSPDQVDALGTTNGWILGAFIQDKWVMNDRLTLNIGLRWDGEINTLDNTFTVPWANDPVIVNNIPSDYINRGNRSNMLNNFGPRVSVNYDLFGNGTTILRGGYGLFYDRVPQYVGYFEWEDASWRIYTIQNPGTLNPDSLRAIVQKGGVNAAPSIDLVNTKMWLPRFNQWSIGIGQQVSEHLAVSVDYVNKHVSNIYKAWNVNYYDPVQKKRILTPNYGDIWLWGSFGRAYYYGILSSVTYSNQLSDDFKIFAQLAYTLSWAYSDDDANTYTLQSLFYRQRSTLDERHRVVLNWRFDLPYGFQLSGVGTIASPTPYSISIGQDLNNDNNYGDDWPGGVRYAVPTASKIRNWYKDLDLRITKTFSFPGGYRFLLMFDAYSIGNWYNASGYFGRMKDASGNPLSTFGTATGSYAPRTMQLGARVYF